MLPLNDHIYLFWPLLLRIKQCKENHEKLKINFALFNNLIVTSFFVCIFSFPKRNKINSFSSLTSILMHNFSVFNDRSFHLLYLIKVLVTLVTDLFQFTFSIDTNPIGNL